MHPSHLQGIEQRFKRSVGDLHLLDGRQTADGKLPCLEGFVTGDLWPKPQRGSKEPNVTCNGDGDQVQSLGQDVPVEHPLNAPAQW